MMRGLTLAETLVVIAILSSAGIALSGALATFYRQNAYVLESTSAADSARRGLTTALQNLREASYGDDGAYPVLSAATSSVSFHAEVDGDTRVEKIRFHLTNGTLYRNITNSAGNPPSYAGQAQATSTVATSVKNATGTPLFRYYDASGAELSYPIDLADVTQIAVRIDVDLNPNRAPEIFTLSGSATLRNVRDQ